MDHPKRSTAAAPSLPDDALVEILSRLPAKSLCRFKCVSRAWRDLIADRLRCNRLPQTLEGFYVFDGDDETQGGSSDAGGVSPDRVVHGRFINALGKSSPLASFSFLGKQPGIEEFGLLRSCNGLLLFGHRKAGDSYDSLGYIVCNPATEQWVAVPSSGWKPLPLFDELEDPGSDSDTEIGWACTYLIFNSAVSSHFQLVEFISDDYVSVEEVRAYSSETGVWCDNHWSSDYSMSFFAGSAVVNGMLHLSVSSFHNDTRQDLILAVDGQGKECRSLSSPQKCFDVAFVGESQGLVHCLSQHKDNTRQMTELSIWVLQDYDAEEWVLRQSVDFFKLFGRMNCRVEFDYSVVAIHPDRNLIFFFQQWDLKLKSYAMDRKEVCTLCTLGVGPQNIFPLVPYYAESSALANKH